MRTSTKIELMLTNFYPCFLGTLTMSDENIMVPHKYIISWMKQNCSYFVCNEDHGTNENFTKRRHYHFIGVFYPTPHIWSLGWSKFKEIVVPNKTALTIYLKKLNQHGIKKSSSRQFDSKNFKELLREDLYDHELMSNEHLFRTCHTIK